VLFVSEAKCVRSSSKSAQKTKLAKQQSCKNSTGLKGKKRCTMPEARLVKWKIHAKGKKGNKCLKRVNKGAIK